MKNYWQEVKLGDICEYSRNRISISEVNLCNYVSTENLLKERAGKTIADSIPEQSNFYEYNKGCTLVSNIRPYFKKIWFADIRGGCSNDVLVYRPNKEINDKWLYYLLSQDSFFDFVMSGAKGTKMPRGDKSQIMKFSVALPPLDEQKKIAAILSALDDKIELNNKINRNLEAQAQAIFKSWFIDFEPFGGKMPADWKQGYLSDVLSTIESGSRPKGGSELSGVPSIGAENIDGIGHYDYTKEKYINRNFFQNLRHGKVNSGDVLLYKDGAYVGKVSMALNGFPHKICAVNEHVFILRTNECLPSQSYLYLFLTQRSIRNKISTLGSAKAAQPGINQGDIKGIALTIPNQKMIQTFENATSSIFNMIVQNSIQSRCLAQLRDTLLPKLMSGEIDISNIAV